jgi:hypothetical protein
MIDLVDQTLALWRAKPFAWGQADCMLSIGDYLASCGAVDVTGLFRGGYATEADALARMAVYGGVGGLIEMTGARSVPIEECQRGDVVSLDTGSVEVGALCTGRGVAARLHRGVGEWDRRFVHIAGVWRVSSR